MKKNSLIFGIVLIFLFSLGTVFAGSGKLGIDGGPLGTSIPRINKTINFSKIPRINKTINFSGPPIINKTINFSKIHGRNKTINFSNQLKTYIKKNIFGKRMFNGKNVFLKKYFDGLQIRVGNFSANCSKRCNLIEEREGNKSHFKAILSNGKHAIIKFMPDKASEIALKRLRMKVCNESQNCSLELKEVGEGNNSKMAYELEAFKKARFLGIFGTRMRIKAQVDSETGEVIGEERPWWSFLVSEKDEVEEDLD